MGSSKQSNIARPNQVVRAHLHSVRETFVHRKVEGFDVVPNEILEWLQKKSKPHQHDKNKKGAFFPYLMLLIFKLSIVRRRKMAKSRLPIHSHVVGSFNNRQ